MKTIMCFGDSNTWGYIPMKDGREEIAKRYSYDVRWPGVLSRLLGDEYHVFEEGLSGRTTSMDDVLGKYRNGAKYIGVCLTTNKPVDLLIIMLGANDTKRHHRASTAQIGRGLERLIKIARSGEYGPEGASPKILVVSPVHIREEVFSCWMSPDFDQHSIEKSRALADLFFEIAHKNDCYYMNAGVYAKASAVDGLHLDPKNHRKLAEAIHIKIMEIL